MAPVPNSFLKVKRRQAQRQSTQFTVVLETDSQTSADPVIGNDLERGVVDRDR